MAKEANGILKKLANALKPLKYPFMAMIIIWGISGVAAVVFPTQWLYSTILLFVLTFSIVFIVDYQAEKEKKKGEH